MKTIVLKTETKPLKVSKISRIEKELADVKKTVEHQGRLIDQMIHNQSKTK